MGVYFVKDKGWRYNFILKGKRYTKAWFKTKKEAKQAEARKREEVENPTTGTEVNGLVEQTSEDQTETQTGMEFFELVNLRLDYVKAYNSERHYTDHIYLAKKWVKEWKQSSCDEVTTESVQKYLIRRQEETSSYTANKELRYLRALFNFALHPSRNLVDRNPTTGIDFFPVDKTIKYVPPKEDVLRVILAADSGVQDYLWTIALTIGRMSEINRLTWADVNFDSRFVILYTRKKRGGHLTPRKVPMPDKLHKVLSRRFEERDKHKPWVFWHRYWSRKGNEWVEGPFKDRKKIMKALCQKAGVKYFRFHALRHFGASLLDSANVPIGSIQRILGHENRTTTEIYLHSIGEGERDAMDILNSRFEEKSHTESHTKKKG